MAQLTLPSSVSSSIVASSQSNVTTPHQKPDLKAIFETIGKRVCQVSTIRGRCSGILLGGRTILVPFHAIGLKEEEKLPDNNIRYSIFPIEVAYQDTTYTAHWSSRQKLNNAYFYDICLFEIEDDDFRPPQNLKLYIDPPSPGDKVYFAGYPLRQSNASFHKGVVSSVETSEDTSYFMIDGTVLPGNSGGAVFIYKGNELLLIGIIFAELANIDPSFIQEKQLVKERLTDSTLVMVMSGVKVNLVLTKVIDTVFDNLATGIGKVISTKHVQDLINRTTLPKPPSPFSIGFPVIKGEQLPGQLGTDPVYADWYHRKVKGKTLCGTILGIILYSEDLIDKNQEKDRLRPYYEKNVLNSATKGHSNAPRTTLDKWLTLKEKILAAKPKAIKEHKEDWKNLLIAYKKDLPDLQAEIDQLIVQLT